MNRPQKPQQSMPLPERLKRVEPFWKGAKVYAESGFFVEYTEGAAAEIRMLRPVGEVNQLEMADTSKVFAEGVDFEVAADRMRILLTPTSRITYLGFHERFPKKGRPMSITQHLDGTRNLYFSEGHVFHDQQVVVDYVAAGPYQGVVPDSKLRRLPKVAALLRAGKPLRVTVLGDSISTGANASGATGAAPWQPPYPQLVADVLQSKYRSAVTVTNFSVGGMDVRWGLTQVAKVIDSNPDLVVLAFGMNDASGQRTPEEYARLTQDIVGAVAASKPDCEFILVATMTGNPDWSYAAPELYPKYRDALVRIETTGVAVADVTALWMAVVSKKSFMDITGNGVNHPNDYGHRLYAMVVAATLGC
jgi:lysophospholipase L1-like esterase